MACYLASWLLEGVSLAVEDGTRHVSWFQGWFAGAQAPMAVG